MSREELLERISIDPEICFGKPCIRGHRIWVSLILDFLANGASVKDILQDYPQLEEADIMACIATVRKYRGTFCRYCQRLEHFRVGVAREPDLSGALCASLAKARDLPIL